MARYKVILAYDGSGFSGSQRQANSRTVQGELEKALRTMGWTERTILMSGRTDTGVHASGQVAAFDLEWRHSPERLMGALNKALPNDLVIRGMMPAAPGFHPRFDAVSREYRYRVFIDPLRDPLRETSMWRVWPAAETDALNQAAGIFLGTHDFAAFGSRTSPMGTTVRTVTRSEWRCLTEGELQYSVTADAFLYRMVRRLVYVQTAAAQGRCSVEQIRQALKGQGILPAGLAPAHGLTLVEVAYGSQVLIEN